MPDGGAPWEPDGQGGGEEYYLTSQSPTLSLSLTAGGSCAMHIGNVSQSSLSSLAALVPNEYGPWPWQDGASTPTINSVQIAQVLSIVPSASQVQNCLAP